MSSPVIGSMVINSTLFGVESNVRKNLNFENQMTNLALSGAIGGFVQGALLTPIEIVKIQMQIECSKYRSTYACVKDLVVNKGLGSLTRGFYLTVLRETPACAMYFVSFEIMTRKEKGDVAPFWHLLIAGGISGCLSWVVTYPVDIIKTVYQADSSIRMTECLKVMKNLGFKGLWRGLDAALLRYFIFSSIYKVVFMFKSILRAFPNNAVCFATVTYINRHFN